MYFRFYFLLLLILRSLSVRRSVPQEFSLVLECAGCYRQRYEKEQQRDVGRIRCLLRSQQCRSRGTTNGTERGQRGPQQAAAFRHEFLDLVPVQNRRSKGGRVGPEALRETVQRSQEVIFRIVSLVS